MVRTILKNARNWKALLFKIQLRKGHGEGAEDHKEKYIHCASIVVIHFTSSKRKKFL